MEYTIKDLNYWFSKKSNLSVFETFIRDRSGALVDSGDIINDTYCKAHRYLSTHSLNLRFTAISWIYTIALNLIRNEVRRKKRWGTEEIEEDYEDRGVVLAAPLKRTLKNSLFKRIFQY